MENYRAVMPEHLNHNGYLFGGALLKWVDENAWIAASLDFPGLSLVTIGMDRVEFRRSVKQGSVLRFLIKQAGKGTTSVAYSVEVFNCLEQGEKRDSPVFSTTVTLVGIGPGGRKLPLP